MELTFAKAAPPTGPVVVARSPMTANGRRYERIVVRTDWIRPGDDLAAIMRTALCPIAKTGDWAIVSEKAVTIASELAVPVDSIVVGPLARRLAGWVRPTAGSRGLSIPEKMQFVVDELGPGRILLATLVAALTRPFGVRGMFYVVAGRVARSLDGLRPPFESLLLPSLDPRTAHVLALQIAGVLGLPVAIVDMNDRGGSIRALSHPGMRKGRLRRILGDNPLGQRDQRTPIGLVRRV